MHIEIPCSVPAVLALASMPFGMTATVFWMYAYGLLLLLAAIAMIVPQLPREHGVDKVMPLGRLFYAMSLGVFGTEHFTLTAGIAGLIPRWIPAHMFWAYAVGLGFVLAALSFVVLVQARLAAALTGMTFLIFVCVMDLPGTLRHPDNRFFWALALRQLAFSGGAVAFAISRWSTREQQPWQAPGGAAWKAVPRFFVGLPALFYGVEQLLHPAYVPGIPLNKLTPEWIPGSVFLAILVGVVSVVAGACLLVNRKARMAAVALGLTLLLAMLWVYLPMLVAAPRDIVALNYFFDTLMFCGTVLLTAGAMDTPPR